MRAVGGPDERTGEKQVFDHGPGRSAGEPVFIGRQGSEPVLIVVFSTTGWLRLLPDLAGGPDGRVGERQSCVLSTI